MQREKKAGALSKLLNSQWEGKKNGAYRVLGTPHVEIVEV
jgi:hypothetical protein